MILVYASKLVSLPCCYGLAGFLNKEDGLILIIFTFKISCIHFGINIFNNLVERQHAQKIIQINNYDIGKKTQVGDFLALVAGIIGFLHYDLYNIHERKVNW